MKIDWEKSLKVGGAVIGLVALGYGLYRYEGAASANESAAEQAADEADENMVGNFPDEIEAGQAGVEEIPSTSESGDNDNEDAVLEALIAALLGPNSQSTNKTSNPTPAPATTAKKTTTTTKKTTTKKATTTPRNIRTTKPVGPHTTPRHITTPKPTTTRAPLRPTAHPVKPTNRPSK